MNISIAQNTHKFASALLDLRRSSQFSAWLLYLLLTSLAVDLKTHYSLDLIIAVTFIFLFLNLIFFLFSILTFPKTSHLALIILGLLPTIFLATETQWLRLFHGNKFLSWNPDWRQSMAFSRSFGLYPDGSSNTMYSGFQSKYHIPESLFSNVMNKVFGLEYDFTLIVILPTMTICSLFLLMKVLGDTIFKLSFTKISIAAFLFLMNPFFDPAGFKNILENYQYPLISPRVMLNTQMAIILISATVVLAIRQKSHVIVALSLSSTCISLTGIKPQIIPHYLVIAIVLFFLSAKSNRATLICTMTTILLFFAASAFSLFLAKTQSAGPSLNVSFSFSALEGYFESIPNSILLFYFIVLITLIWTSLKFRIQTNSSLIVYVLPGFFLLFILERALQELVIFGTSDPIASNRALFEGEAALDAWDFDLGQGRILIFIAISALFFLTLIRVSQNYLSRLRIATLILAFCLIVSPKMFYGLKILNKPDLGYAFVDSSYVGDILSKINRSGAIISNDITEPSSSYLRFGRGEYLATTSSQSFYFLGPLPDFYMADDFKKRYDLISQVFNQEVGEGEIAELKNAGVSWLLVTNRCVPFWFESVSVFSRNPQFSLIRLLDFERLIGSDDYLSLRPIPQVKIYGLSKCL
jgi:hypothetical protein